MIAAASVYAACRCNGRTLLLEDTVAVARVDETRVTNAYSVLNRELELLAQSIRPWASLARFSSGLELRDRIQRRAEHLQSALKSSNSYRDGHSGFAAACLYVAARESDWCLTQSQVAVPAGVSTNTILGH